MTAALLMVVAFTALWQRSQTIRRAAQRAGFTRNHTSGDGR